MSEEYDPFNARNPKAARKTGKSKTLVSVTTSSGEVIIPPTDVDDVREALAEVRDEIPEKARKAAARKATKPKESDDAAMFSEQETGEQTVNTIAAGQLRAFIERIERQEEEKKAAADDIKDIYAEAKGCGFSVKAIRTIVRLRKQDQAERQEEEAILDLYKAALGMA